MAEVLGEAAKEVIYGSEIELTAPLDTPTLPSAAFMPRGKGLGQEGEYERNPFQSTNPFDESADLDEGSYANLLAQNYQIRTGSRRGLLSRGYSTSEESLDRVSMLSVIPEESMVDMQTAESCDLPPLQSHDSRSRSHDHSQDDTCSGGGVRGGGVPTQQTPSREESTEVPWYQENSQLEVWETTPAYCHQQKGVWSERNPRRTGVPSSFQKAVVTEEIKPVLQVSQSSETQCHL